MSDRQRLANTREHEVIEFEHAGIAYRAGVGRFPDGRLAEVFLDAGKQGTGINVAARDAAVILSLALQSGCEVGTIRHALTKLADGRGAGPLGALFDLLEAGETVT